MEMALRGSLQRLRYNTRVCILSCFYHGKMTAANVSDNLASQTKLCTVKSDICFLLVSSASSLVPIPPVSQWHEHTSEVSISSTMY